MQKVCAAVARLTFTEHNSNYDWVLFFPSVQGAWARMDRCRAIASRLSNQVKTFPLLSSHNAIKLETNN